MSDILKVRRVGSLLKYSDKYNGCIIFYYFLFIKVYQRAYEFFIAFIHLNQQFPSHNGPYPNCVYSIFSLLIT